MVRSHTSCYNLKKLKCLGLLKIDVRILKNNLIEENNRKTQKNQQQATGIKHLMFEPVISKYPSQATPLLYIVKIIYPQSNSKKGIITQCPSVGDPYRHLQISKYMIVIRILHKYLYVILETKLVLYITRKAPMLRDGAT